MNNTTILNTVSQLTFLNLVILAAAAYSITRLVVTDHFFLFSKPRQWVLDRFPPEGAAFDTPPPDRVEYRRTNAALYVVTKGHWLGELITCPWCAGFWISLGVYSAFVVEPDLTLFLSIPMVMRAAVGALATKLGG